jgi:NADH-quinone oxidoreductase subunit I
VSIWGTGILKGMMITMRNMLRGPITVQYPRERIELPERARWAVELKRDEDGEHKCTACMACAKACPDFIIDLEVTTDEERNKTIDYWRYEVGACMMCGLCVEACPFDAIKMGRDYELARLQPEELTYDLLVDSPAAKPKRKTPPAAAAKAPAEPVDAPVSPPEPAASPAENEEASAQ